MKPLFKVALRYGLMGGGICSIAIMVLFWIDVHPFLVPVIFDFRLFLFGVLIFFTLKEIRDYIYNGILYFWQGMIASYTMLMTSAVIGSLFTWVFATFHKGFIPSYINLLLKQFTTNKALIIENVGEEAYQQQLTKLPLTSAGDLAADYFLKSMIIGLFLTIIFSVIIRRQPKTL